MSDELVKLDLSAIPRQPKQRAEIEYIAEATKRCEKLFKQARLIINYHLVSYEEMNLIFRMESYFEKNGHIGVHWYKQLWRIVQNYLPKLVEKQVEDMMLD